MDTPSRRALLHTAGAGLLAGLAGCVGGGAGTSTPGDTRTRSPTPTASPTPLGRPPVDLLPTERGGWELLDAREATMALGDIVGWRGTYRSPDDVRFEALVLRDVVQPGDAGRNAEWLAHEGLTYAASSGTEVGERTPETPIVMDRTPIPDTADDAAALLALAPRLTATIVESRRSS